MLLLHRAHLVPLMSLDICFDCRSAVSCSCISTARASGAASLVVIVDVRHIHGPTSWLRDTWLLFCVRGGGQRPKLYLENAH